MSESCPRCGTPNVTGRVGICPLCILKPDAPPEIVGETLEIHEEIGRGGMGTVYRGRHRKLDRTVAIKFLPSQLAAQPEFMQRFEREARALAMLNHPNIVGVHDIGTEEGLPYIVMEYVEGASLAAHIPMETEKQAIHIALQVCDALAYAHAQGVVHRDIKPENILLDLEDRVKVADFGIARIVRPGTPRSTVTATNVALGTPNFMAPEIVEGARPEPRMDIYSLGVVLYQAVTGNLPQGDFAPLEGPLDAVVRKALAPDPERRFNDAAEFREALEGLEGKTTDDSSGLSPDEMTWVRTVAILQAISTVVALWAFVVMVSPKTFESDELLPLIHVGTEKQEDGRFLSRARFETFPALATLLTFALAIIPYGLLRRHWRRSGLQVNTPERPVPGAWRVFAVGVTSLAIFGVHRGLEGVGLL